MMENLTILRYPVGAAAFIALLFAAASVADLLRGPGLIKRIKALLGSCFWLCTCFLLSSWIVLMSAFHAFSKETLVAYVTAQRDSATQFTLNYQPINAALPVRVKLRGDQWAVSGGIIKWHPWLAVLGLESYHQEMRIEGRFSDIRKQQANPASVEALQEPWLDRFWEALYWAGEYLPFVDAVYGSAGFAYVEPSRVQEVFVTATGYLIRRSEHKEIPVTPLNT